MFTRQNKISIGLIILFLFHFSACKRVVEESTPVGLPTAGWPNPGWQTDNQFILMMDEIGNINMYRFDMTFAGDEVTIALTERTGLFDETFSGWRNH